MNPFKYLIILVAAAGISGCGGNVTLDNAFPDKATIEIDGQAHTLDGGERQTISLDPGNHQIKVSGSDGALIADTSIRLKEGGLIHTGGDSYVIWRRLYGLQKEKATLLHEDWVELDSSKLYGDFKIFPNNMVFIEQNWDFGLDEELPESVKLYSTSDFTVKSKVFRMKELIETYKRLAAAAPASN